LPPHSGAPPSPSTSLDFAALIARNVSDAEDGFLRDTPNLNAFAGSLGYVQ
jgi:hypothetical protein